MAARKTTTRKATTPAPTDLVQVGELELRPGNYKKVTTRPGVAFLTVMPDGSLSYTNRRGEIAAVDAKKFGQIWKTGLTTQFA